MSVKGKLKSIWDMSYPEKRKPSKSQVRAKASARRKSARKNKRIFRRVWRKLI